MEPQILSEINTMDLKMILNDRSGKFYGPFDNLMIGKTRVDNLFIRNIDGKLQLTDRMPYKVGGSVMDPEQRNRLANKRNSNRFYIPFCQGAALISVEYPSKIKVFEKLNSESVNKLKESSYSTIKKALNLEELRAAIREVQLLLDKNERSVFSEKIRDRMKELVELHNLEKAKGTKKSMVTISDETAEYMKSVIDNERTQVKLRDIEKSNAKKEERNQSLSTKLSKGLNH